MLFSSDAFADLVSGNLAPMVEAKACGASFGLCTEHSCSADNCSHEFACYGTFSCNVAAGCSAFFCADTHNPPPC